ncbi:hypothetical protein [Peribacillus sp. SI8-4]|uniref:hypothetical protein n=1 Tax=Peribacillus sp. SI8-4 TaxID=3048009 RepID=UPI0025555562|nr:hypothetical protein [Peribacillus sp. SI8-4]
MARASLALPRQGYFHAKIKRTRLEAKSQLASKVSKLASKSPKLASNAPESRKKAVIMRRTRPECMSKAKNGSERPNFHKKNAKLIRIPLTIGAKSQLASKVSKLASKSLKLASKVIELASKSPKLASNAPESRKKAVIMRRTRPECMSKAKNGSERPNFHKKNAKLIRIPLTIGAKSQLASKVSKLASKSLKLASKSPKLASNAPESRVEIRKPQVMLQILNN